MIRYQILRSKIIGIVSTDIKEEFLMRTWERKGLRMKEQENSSSMGANGKLSTSEWKQKDSVGHQNLAKEY